MPLLIIFGCLGMLIWPICSVLYRVEDRIFITHCAISLQHIGTALSNYANSHDGGLPANWEDLVSHTEDMPAHAFVCGGRHRNRDDWGDDPKQNVKDIDGPDGKFFSFVYAGRGRNEKLLNADEVIAFERLGNHYNYAVNVLFADRSVQLLWCKPGTPDAEKYARLLVDHVSGVRPLRLRQ